MTVSPKLRVEMAMTVLVVSFVHRYLLLNDGVARQMDGAAQESKGVLSDERRPSMEVGDQQDMNSKQVAEGACWVSSLLSEGRPDGDCDSPRLLSCICPCRGNVWEEETVWTGKTC